jgi:hypothetical protein
MRPDDATRKLCARRLALVLSSNHREGHARSAQTVGPVQVKDISGHKGGASHETAQQPARRDIHDAV